MKQDVIGYFVKLDEFGKSEMDYFIETKMDFGNAEELSVAPTPVKSEKMVDKTSTKSVPKKWAPTKPMMGRPRLSSVRKGVRSVGSNVQAKPKAEKFCRVDMREEVRALEMEELKLCNDDFGVNFDLEL